MKCVGDCGSSTENRRHAAGFRISSLVPSGLVFDGVSDSEDSIILAVRSEAAEAQCPLCATATRRVHSRYIRHVAELPSAGRKVPLRLLKRRFTCEVPYCRRRIFTERLGEDVVPLRRRRTARLEHIVHHLGLALGGRPAASFAKRLMLPVSNDTLLLVRRRKAMPMDPLLVVGIDDWAFPTPKGSWSARSFALPTSRIATARQMSCAAFATASPGCAISSPMAAMPAKSSRRCWKRSAGGLSRSSSAPMPHRASRCFRAAGRSNEQFRVRLLDRGGQFDRLLI
ncbi:transposase IS204/IS1001/IS1096/IS1165 family protein [Bradyrhizobium stylosanthis]|uniref:Transposase IS204/IS1001/IS1096/IS1165 family protein n=1 Tax=Bradyrhizobium stylosanthis TaxID=1803665 RepID=A0A560D4P2_9BRAD|nr:transposase IS204/IS1001/IS1096/IS1165 family protein [Bradyrhizobium stylosanthis]